MMQKIQQAVPKRFGELPVKLLQIGTGNFLRAFIGPMIERMNAQGLFGGSYKVVQTQGSGTAARFNAQNGLYTVLSRGIEGGTFVEEALPITSVREAISTETDYARFLAEGENPDLAIVLSNTTEAGLVYEPDCRLEDCPPHSYPAKLTALLYRRFTAFGGSDASGLLILPLELVDQGGDRLKTIVLRHAGDWQLGEDFCRWLETGCTFANTLVDRIVTGYPSEEDTALFDKLGYTDPLLTTCEPFSFFAIEGDPQLADRFPARKAGFDVVVERDISRYRMRKVRLLNGAHTTLVAAGYLAGHDTVRACITDPIFRRFLERALEEEIIPNVPMDPDELHAFKDAILDRFLNPSIRHRLLDIALHSVSKFTVRLLPSIQAAADAGRTTPLLAFSLAALLRFYRVEPDGSGGYRGMRGDTPYPVREDEAILRYFSALWQGDTTGTAVARAALANTALWGEDLTRLPGLQELVAAHLDAIEAEGILPALQQLLG